MQRKAAKEKDREENGTNSGQEGGRDGKREKKLVLRPLEPRAYQPGNYKLV